MQQRRLLTAATQASHHNAQQSEKPDHSSRCLEPLDTTNKQKFIRSATPPLDPLIVTCLQYHHQIPRDFITNDDDIMLRRE